MIGDNSSTQLPHTTSRGLTPTSSPQSNYSVIPHVSSMTDMSQSSTSFRPLFNAALQDYAKKTGTKLDDHPLAKQLENCDSVDSISSVLQEQAQRFYEFRGEDGKIMTSLKAAVQVLYTLSTSTVLGEGIGIVRSTIAHCQPFVFNVR
jgi:fungal STAND N-terminal Goodbye domain